MPMNREFEFSVYDNENDLEISFRRATLDKDLTRLHDWHHKAHVIPFWKQNFPLQKYEENLKKLLADPHQTLYIGYLNDVPMSYWEAYWAKDDVIANYYDVHQEDQGVHLLFGPEEYLGRGFALPLLKAMVAFQLEHLQTEKVVAEPDIRNKKMIHIFEKCGFKTQKEIDLPDKRGLLMYCQRKMFTRRIKDESLIQKRNKLHV